MSGYEEWPVISWWPDMVLFHNERYTLTSTDPADGHRTIYTRQYDSTDNPYTEVSLTLMEARCYALEVVDE